MKFLLSLALCTVVASLIASSDALPAKKRMIYYQQPAQWYSAPQRMMYVQYVQPSRTHARSTQAASALVAGDTVATGTYLHDCNHDETNSAAAGPAVAPVDHAEEENEDEIAAAGAHVAQSVAEAYPEEEAANANEAADAAETVQNDNAAKVPRDYQFEAEEPSVAEVPIAKLPAPAPIAPAAPAKRYLPAAGSKKVIVELEQPADNEDAEEQADNAVAVPTDAESDDDEEVHDVVQYPNARRPAVRKPAKASGAKPLPAGTFFPINFGGTSGGAIAIANSFSTGEGGSATSHAIAYGSPETVRARAQPSRRH